MIPLIFEGTHDIWNVIISYSSPGEISISGNFISDSIAKAILAIVYSDSCSGVHYIFSSLSIEEEKLTAAVSGLPSGMYNVSVFVVEDNGLPFNRSAITPRNITIIDGGRGELLRT